MQPSLDCSTYRLSAWQISLLSHAAVIMLFILVWMMKKTEPAYLVPIEIVLPNVQKLELKDETRPIVLKSVNQSKQIQARSARQVFGVSRDAQLADPKSQMSDAIDAKLGNTLAKTVDQQVLTKDDQDVLPVPMEDYLVSKMPSVAVEVRPVYPAQAREKGLEGLVTLSILIDATGKVREATIISGDDIFKQVALEAIKNFKFNPAQVDGKPVAVKIAYSIRFDLDY